MTGTSPVTPIHGRVAFRRLGVTGLVPVMPRCHAAHRAIVTVHWHQWACPYHVSLQNNFSGLHPLGESGENVGETLHLHHFPPKDGDLIFQNI